MKDNDRQLELFPPEPLLPKRQMVRTKEGHIVVRAKRRKEVDVDKLVATLLRILEQMDPAERRALSKDAKGHRKKRAA